MTHLQVQYQQLEETKRANQATEEIKSREAQVKENLAKLEELKVPAEVQKLLSEANLSDQKMANLIAELDQIKANVELTLSKAGLTEEQKRLTMLEAEQEAMNIIHRTTAQPYPGDIADWFGSLFGGFSKGFGSRVGKALIG